MTRDELYQALNSVHRLLNAVPGGTLEAMEVLRLGMIFGEVSKWLAEKEAEQAEASQIEGLRSQIELLTETTDMAIKHLAAHVSNLALQVKIDHGIERKHGE